MSLTSMIKEKIEKAFQPEHFELINDSHKHRGHAGDNGSGETHFRLLVVSDGFFGLSRIQRHRVVYDVLDGAFSMGLHALSMRTLTPEEYKKQ